MSGLPSLVERTGATAYLPAGAGVSFEHVALGDGDRVEFDNTIVRALETPGHAPSHGRGLSGNPFSTIGFERRHNALAV